MFKIKLILMLVALVGMAGGFAYVKNLQSQNEILRLNQEKLEVAIELQQELVEQQLADMESQKELYEQQRATIEYTVRELDHLNERYNKLNASGAQRDIGNLAINRPSSVEFNVNKEITDRNRCNEIATGSPLTEEELAATKKSQANRICPELANPNYREGL